MSRKALPSVLLHKSEVTYRDTGVSNEVTYRDTGVSNKFI